MDIIISFFRDTLDGPVYIVVVVVAVILFFACIGYLAEKSINTKKEKAKYAKVENDSATGSDNSVNDVTEVSDSNVNESVVNPVNVINSGVVSTDSIYDNNPVTNIPNDLGSEAVTTDVPITDINVNNVETVSTTPIDNVSNVSNASNVVEMPTVTEVSSTPGVVNQDSVVSQDTAASIVIPTINQENSNNN